MRIWSVLSLLLGTGYLYQECGLLSFKASAELGGREWVQGKLKCHRALLLRHSCFFLIKYAPVSASFWLLSRVVKKLFWWILPVYSLLLWKDGLQEFPTSLILQMSLGFFPCLWWLERLGNFFRMPHHWYLSDIFLHDYTRVMQFWRNTTEVCHSHHIVSQAYAINMAYYWYEEWKQSIVV